MVTPNHPERAAEDRALEAAAVDIVMRLSAAAREGLDMPGTDRVIEIMRKHGLRGPEPFPGIDERGVVCDTCGAVCCGPWEADANREYLRLRPYRCGHQGTECDCGGQRIEVAVSSIPAERLRQRWGLMVERAHTTTEGEP